MFIKSIQIELAPAAGETHSPVTLNRDDKKLWCVVEDGLVRGLYPSEVKLVTLIQTEVIEKWSQRETK